MQAGRAADRIARVCLCCIGRVWPAGGGKFRLGKDCGMPGAFGPELLTSISGRPMRSLKSGPASSSAFSSSALFETWDSLVKPLISLAISRIFPGSQNVAGSSGQESVADTSLVMLSIWGSGTSLR